MAESSFLLEKTQLNQTAEKRQLFRSSAEKVLQKRALNKLKESKGNKLQKASAKDRHEIDNRV